MIDNKNALSNLSEIVAEQTCNSLCKHVIQASTASSHRVGKCLFEPSKQSRIRRSSFWSHRRSTVQWETALSSKERSRRVNCPMIAPFFGCFVLFLFWYMAFHSCWSVGLSLVLKFQTFKPNWSNAFYCICGLDLFYLFISLSLFLSCFHMVLLEWIWTQVIACFLSVFYECKVINGLWSDPFIEAVTSCNFWVCLKNGCVDTVTSWFVTPPNMCSFGMRWI